MFEDNCSVCHGVSGRGGNGGPSLRGVTDLARVLRQVGNGGGGMPAFRGRLNDAEIRAVAGYVAHTLAAR